jgi:excisionase family DNA binding protein
MTVRDLALYLKVDEKTVYRLAQRRQLPGFKVAGTWRFKRADIDAWIEQRKTDSVEGEVKAKTGDSGGDSPSAQLMDSAAPEETD